MSEIQPLRQATSSKHEIFCPCRSSTSEDFPSNVKRPKYSVLDQSAWSKVGMETMPEWRRALKEVFPEIRKAVEREL